MSNTAKLFLDFWLIGLIGTIRFIKLRFRFFRIGVQFICLIHFILLVESTMSTSPSISSISYQKVLGEHLKTRITDLFIYNLCIFSSKLVKYEVDIPKAVLIFLPVVFSQAGRSDASLHLLEAGFFSFDAQLPERFPQEDWNQLFSSCYKAWKSAISMSRRLTGLFKSSKS